MVSSPPESIRFKEL